MMPQPYQQDVVLPPRVGRPNPGRSLPAKPHAILPAPIAGRFHAGPRVGASSCPPEVVFVFEQGSLIDSESYQRTYARKGGQPLACGHYVVTWPEGRKERLFGEEAVFHGPYQSRKDAENSLALFQRVLASPLRGVPPWPGYAPMSSPA